MSYNVIPIAVDLQKLTAAVGGKDASLLSTLQADFADECAGLDEDDENYYDADEGEPPVATAAEVLRHLLMGEPQDDRVAFKYGYALVWLCARLGRGLSNREWSSLRWDWITQTDEALDAAGVPASLFRVGRQLLCRGAPVSIPRIDDFPSIGYLRRDEIPAVRTALAAVSIGDTEVRSSIEELLGWLQTCTDSGCDLVCYYA